jgi:hypothetical protein
MEQDIKKSCWNVTFWTVTAFVVALSIAYLAKQGDQSQSVAIQSEAIVQ